MTRRTTAVAAVVLALSLGAGCGKYGKPVRHHPPASPAPAAADEPSDPPPLPDAEAAEPAP